MLCFLVEGRPAAVRADRAALMPTRITQLRPRLALPLPCLSLLLPRCPIV